MLIKEPPQYSRRPYYYDYNVVGGYRYLLGCSDCYTQDTVSRFAFALLSLALLLPWLAEDAQ